MKIRIGNLNPEGQITTLTPGIMHEVRIEECYLGIAMETDQGVFGISQRDDGIEVMLNGQLVWSSMELKGAPRVFNPPPVPDDEGFIDKEGSMRMEKFLKTRTNKEFP